MSQGSATITANGVSHSVSGNTLLRTRADDAEADWGLASILIGGLKLSFETRDPSQTFDTAAPENFLNLGGTYFYVAYGWTYNDGDEVGLISVVDQPGGPSVPDSGMTAGLFFLALAACRFAVPRRL